jgi:hypothetical protein
MPGFTTRERMLLKLLPAQFLGHGGEPDADPYIRLLQVADFVAGMTDSYAVDMYPQAERFRAAELIALLCLERRLQIALRKVRLRRQAPSSG